MVLKKKTHWEINQSPGLSEERNLINTSLQNIFFSLNSFINVGTVKIVLDI